MVNVKMSYEQNSKPSPRQGTTKAEQRRPYFIHIPASASNIVASVSTVVDVGESTDTPKTPTTKGSSPKSPSSTTVGMNNFFKHIPLHTFSFPNMASPPPTSENIHSGKSDNSSGNFDQEHFLRKKESLFSRVKRIYRQASRYRPSRFSFTSRRARRRVVLKSGDCNIAQANVAKRRRRYLADIFTTLVDIKWRWTLLIFTLSFILSWMTFAGIWYLIMYSHGDFMPRHLPELQEETGWTPCVAGVDSFATCFLFSLETQHTIGYGARYPTDECPETLLIMCIQSITGIMIQALMVGIVFAKISRPKKRTQTLVFSRNAVICQRDGQLCLLFRVGDMRKSHIIEAHVRAQLIRRRVTLEGEVIPFHQQEIKVGPGDGEDHRLFFIWPTTVVHRMDKTSPLYNVSASDLLREKFEIVVFLEGVIESTGMTTQARHSYLTNEILWGHRFDNILSFRKEMDQFAVDYTHFHNTTGVDTPLCSQKRMDEICGIQDGNNNNPDASTVPHPPSDLQLLVPPVPPSPCSMVSGQSSAPSSPSTMRTLEAITENQEQNNVPPSPPPIPSSLAESNDKTQL